MEDVREDFDRLIKLLEVNHDRDMREMLIRAHVSRWRVDGRHTFLEGLKSAGVYIVGDLNRIEFCSSATGASPATQTTSLGSGARQADPVPRDTGRSAAERYVRKQKLDGARRLAPMMCPRQYATVEGQQQNEADVAEFERLQRSELHESLADPDRARLAELKARIQSYNRARKEKGTPKTPKSHSVPASCTRRATVLQRDGDDGVFIAGNVQTATVEEHGFGTLDDLFNKILKRHAENLPATAEDLKPIECALAVRVTSATSAMDAWKQDSDAYSASPAHEHTHSCMLRTLGL